jgi:hypothetical protein
MCFLKHIFGYTALHKTVDRLNLRLEWYVYVNNTTRSLRGKKLDKLRGIDDFSLYCRSSEMGLLYFFC